MSRRIFAAVGLCIALICTWAPASANKILEKGVQVDGKYVIYFCVDSKPHAGGEGCPGDKMFVYDTSLLKRR